ncbi:MAG TPA: TrpB-like pyridoxal phosphate-dependent enzyme [Acidimicrobiia bacterium]|jgi:tryptophan synthase beta chain|nr:TrpB-like pyridoxal phosphate-dependent enzyme [Acidimicrobiia bacterium]
MATKITLAESDLPTHWYNIVPDLPSPPPPVLHPGTHEPVGPDDLAPLFPMDLILQEVATERFIEIPEEVREVYRLWRPTPMFRAHGLEKLIGGPARIYYKYEGVSPVGSHKPNTAVPQAFYNAKAGVRKLSTETGAGQWGSALAFACAMFGLECEVYQVRSSYDQKPYRKAIIETYGGVIHPSPSTNTEYGRRVLAEDPDTPGSLGIAISEAVEVAATNEDVKYSLGSVLNHVLMHQTVIGEEALKQMALVEETPDVIIGCTGGGSNFSGLVFPFIREKLAGNMDPAIWAIEPAAAPSLTRGSYQFDFGDTGQMTPLVKMHTLGHPFIPDPIHAGGLRYHGMAPLVSHLHELGIIQSQALQQTETFERAVQFARVEGIIPGPEPTHAVAAAMREAERARDDGEEKVILFNLSGHGHFDMGSYQAYLGGELVDYEHPQERIDEAMQKVPVVAG